MESNSLLQGLELSLFLHTYVQTVCLLNKEVANNAFQRWWVEYLVTAKDNQFLFVNFAL